MCLFSCNGHRKVCYLRKLMKHVLCQHAASAPSCFTGLVDHSCEALVALPRLSGLKCSAPVALSGMHCTRCSAHAVCKCAVLRIVCTQTCGRSRGLLTGGSTARARSMTHITLGCGGHKLSDVNHDQPEWLAATYVGFGYGRITVHDGYELTFEFVRTSVRPPPPPPIATPLHALHT